MEIVFNIGSNLGSIKANIGQAIQKLSHEVGTVVKISEPYHSRPVGFESSNNFMNVALLMKTAKMPAEILRTTQAIELQMGRIKNSPHGSYEDRIIDIDIILISGLKFNENDFVVPHPRAHERDFVMLPLLEIQPYMKDTNLISQTNTLFAQSKIGKNAIS